MSGGYGEEARASARRRGEFGCRAIHGDWEAVTAPLEAAWDSIRSGLRRDLGARTFDGWLKPAELGAFEPDSGTLDLVLPRSVHGRLGSLALR